MSQISEKERKFLEEMLKKIESKKMSILLRSWFNPLFWMLCATALLFAFWWHEQTGNSAILVAISALVGIAVGVVSILQNGERSWPYIREHVDVKSIKQSLNNENT